MHVCLFSLTALTAENAVTTLAELSLHITKFFKCNVFVAKDFHALQIIPTINCYKGT